MRRQTGMYPLIQWPQIIILLHLQLFDVSSPRPTVIRLIPPVFSCLTLVAVVVMAVVVVAVVAVVAPAAIAVVVKVVAPLIIVTVVVVVVA